MAYTTDLDKRYLDLNGLHYYDGKLKTWVTSKIGEQNTDFTNTLKNYYTITDADAKFATIANFDAYKTSNDAALAGVKNTADSAKALWDAFLAGYTATDGSVAPTLNAIKVFMETTVPGTYATKDSLSQAITGLADVYLTQATFATEKQALSESITKNANDISALATKVDNQATANGEALTALETKLQGNIDAVDAKADKNTEDITALTQTVASNKTAAETAINNAQTTLQGNIDALAGTVASNKTDIEGKLETAQTTLQGNIDALEGKVTTNTSDISTLKNQILGLNGAVHFRGVFESFEAVTAPANGDIVIIKGAEYVYVEANKDAENGPWEKLGDTTAELEAIEQLGNEIEAVDAKAVKNAEDIAALTNTVADNKTEATNAIAAVDAKAVKNAEDIVALTEAAAQRAQEVNAAIAAVDAKAVKNAEDITALTKTVADNKTAAETAIANCVQVKDFITSDDIDDLFKA